MLIYLIKDTKVLLDYLNDPHRALINEIFISNSSLNITFPTHNSERSNQQQGQHNNKENSTIVLIDCGVFPESIDKLSIIIHKDTRTCGKLPDSITELSIKKTGYMILDSSNIESILSNLPPSLQSLNLPHSFSITSKCVLPSSLLNLNYQNTYDSLQWFVSPPNRDFSNCRLEISPQQLEYLSSNRSIIGWISSITLKQPSVPITKNMIPSNTKDLVINYADAVIETPDSLPRGLEKLICYERLNIKSINISSMNLKYLTLHFPFDETLEIGFFPPTLEYLTLRDYNHPIKPDVLPSRLKSLVLSAFDHKLLHGALPQSLTKLHLVKFNHQIEPNVLPNNIKNLFLYSFDQTTFKSNALPTSITTLHIPVYSGTFELVDCLDHLQTLSIRSLNQSICRVVRNCKSLELIFDQISSDVKLYNTSIEKLGISNDSGSRINIWPDLLPQFVKSLYLDGMDINSTGLIPNTCTYFRSDISGTQYLSYLPSSVKHIKSLYHF
ncbi:hypothetical protein CYY_003135 [Polysphondylium violaceum]|uniref:Uncharacterized protein n=1 Tax=Polysphondylium violaceum TaxID=133409 RepID=A0A8J4Q096_9MYCE|nr:hypothetical protein CYY_003135 [Polysphondylium violaceum]